MMNRPFKLVNFRVVVDVVDHPWIAPKDSKRQEEMLRSHANDLLKVVQPVASGMNDRTYTNARVESDMVCRFCEYPWESAKDAEGNPACCNDAIAYWECSNTNMPTPAQPGRGRGD